MRRMLRAVGMIIAACMPLTALAEYPDRPIRIIVPYSAGGPTDTMARLLQVPLSKELGATVIVENTPGAGGALGAKQVLRAPADGYTIFLGNNGPNAVTPLLQKNSGLEPLKDFTPISRIARFTMMLLANASCPANDMKSLLAYAKANPGKLNYASAGTGSLGHLGTELLLKQSGTQMTHVPYKGMSNTLNALLANEVQLLLTTPTDAVFAHLASGRIKLLGVTSEKPIAQAPNADMINKYVPDFVLYSWFALLVKSGTPEPILKKLSVAVNGVVA